jgi:diguanylate cyclase (GGDEF)-like protein
LFPERVAGSGSRPRLPIHVGMEVTPNRAEFDERIRYELERARRGTGRLSLVLLELDRDHNGRRPRADALDRVEAALHVMTRRIDAAARVGAEEFALLLPESDAAGAFALSQRVRARLLETHSLEENVLTASWGVASFPLDGATAPELLAAADRALHEARRLGGDCTVAHAEIVGSSRA